MHQKAKIRREREKIMSHRDIIVIGASAGGVEALTALVRLLPSDLPAALFIVIHLPPYGRTVLPEILQRIGQLPAALAIDGEPIQAGKIYVAPLITICS